VDGSNEVTFTYNEVEYTVTVEWEEVALAVESISAVNAKTVEIVFSKAVDESTVITSGSPDTLKSITFTEIGTAPAVTSASAEASLSEDGKTLTVVAQTTEYFDGEYAVLVPVTVTDEDGNAIEAYSQVVTLDDTERPSIGTVSYTNNNTAKFEFSEPINLADGTALEGISTLKDKDGSVVSNTGLITLASDKESFTLNMSSLNTDEDYTLTIVGAKDYAGNLISPNPVTVNFIKENADQEKPAVSSVVAVNDTELIVTFTEEIDTTGTYFTLDIGSTGTPVPITSSNATLNDEKTEVTVDLTDATLGGGLGPFAGAISGLKRIDIAAYDDLSSNTGDAYSQLVTFTADGDAPEVATTTLEDILGTRYIVVEFNEDLATVTPVDLSATYLYDGVEKSLTIDSSAVTAYDKDNDGNNESIKIDTEDYDGAGTVNILPEGEYTITLGAGLVADAATNANVSTDINITVGELVSDDTTKPGISTVTVTDNDTVTVVFSEEVANESALNVANYTVEGSQVFDSAVFSGDKTTVKLTLKDGIIDVNGDRLVEIVNVADEAGNVMDDYDTTKTFVENVNPVLVSAQVTDTNKVLLTFSEGIDNTSVENSDFTVKVNDTTDAVTGITQEDGVTALAGGETKILLTLTTGITDLNDVVTVTVEDGVVDDENGNSNEGAETVTASN